ncbi:MAG: UDP-4-amino-4,6-dideoxy-N-acetyl-beta-L-altrosamine transaminase, partial [Rhodocyclaceae bacterium]|nr:UDP-4-amino-4,6-dideoxy-N-acetyl-beta-L-altrosamine transaminase [Rhodocyclaceae bacterium]
MKSAPIPYGRQSISPQDIQAVVDVLSSDWLTQGPTVERFERTVADGCGAAHAVAVNSATSALHIACLAAGLGPGDILWTSPNTFVASANCGLYCGATVDFVDIDPRTCNMSVERLEEKLELAARQGKLPKMVVPVHFAGQSCDMAAIARLADRYGFTVIEDASHAIGGRYQGEPVGNCRYSAMTVFSFHPVKIVTTGEGGMVLTNNAEMHERLMRLRSHGITRDPALMAEEPHGPWYYEQIELGFNYRMTDIQAALGVSQMTRLEEFVARRHHLARRYDEALAGLPLTLPWQHPDSWSAFHLYV